MYADGEAQAHVGIVDVEVVVVAAAEGHLLVGRGLGQTVADAGGLAQVEGRAGHVALLAGGNGVLVDHREGVAVELKDVILDGAAALAGKVEIGMVGQVAEGVAVADGLVADDQLVLVGEGVGDHHLQRAGIALLAVGADVLENQMILADALHRRGVPQLAVKAHVAAVQMGAAGLVLCKGQLLAVEHAFAVGDAVADATDQRAQIAVQGRVALHRGIAQHHAGDVAVAVGHVHGAQDAAEIGDFHRRTMGVGQDVQVGVTAVGRLAEGLLDDAHEKSTFRKSDFWKLLYTETAGGSRPFRRKFNIYSSEYSRSWMI